MNVDLVACNTDVQALAGSVATSRKSRLGRHITRGLGAGAVTRNWAFSAAEEAVDEIRIRGWPGCRWSSFAPAWAAGRDRARPL